MHSANTAQILSAPGTWTNLISRGLLVTNPSPLGKKSSPTIFSNKEDFPLDYEPTTAILGNLIYSYKPTSRNSSMTLTNLRKLSNRGVLKFSEAAVYLSAINKYY